MRTTYRWLGFGLDRAGIEGEVELIDIKRHAVKTASSAEKAP